VTWSAAIVAAPLDTAARAGRIAGMKKPKRKTSVEEVKRDARRRLGDGSYRPDYQKELFGYIAKTGIVPCPSPMWPPSGWFLVHALVDAVYYNGKKTIVMYMHDLPEHSARCDCDHMGCRGRAHYVMLDPDTRRMSLDAIDRATARLRAGPRRRGPPRGRQP
jgi:hypothetical protein